MIRSKWKRAMLALSLDGQEDELVRYAVRFCQKANLELDLYHVSDHFLQYGYDGSYYPRLDLSLPPNERVKAFDALWELKETYCSEINASCVVAEGNLVQGIEDNINSRDIDLVIVGKRRNYHSFIGRLKSQLFRINKCCPVPLLLVPRGSNQAPTISEQAQIIIADSLSSKLRSLLPISLSLASSFSNSSVSHIHVCPNITRDIDQLSQVRFDSIFRDLSNSSPVNTHDLRLEYGSCLEKKMVQNWQQCLSEEGFKGGYNPIVRFGQPQKVLSEMIQEKTPDILVTGIQIHSLFQSIVYRSKVPFREQLDFECPILLVPSQHSDGSESLQAA